MAVMPLEGCIIKTNILLKIRVIKTRIRNARESKDLIGVKSKKKG